MLLRAINSPDKDISILIYQDIGISVSFVNRITEVTGWPKQVSGTLVKAGIKRYACVIKDYTSVSMLAVKL